MTDTVMGSAHILVGMNPRVRRLIVSGVLGGLVLIVLLTAVWNLVR
jgi:hypothetical protein